MAAIRKLPDQLINQIAAGEAVERPSSVVKELVDNALDAGAASIEISVEQGGRRAIRVEDDGSGMTPDDARLALERHATSKIQDARDLGAIRTLGFRGEALPAIASVSRLELRTTPRGASEGFRLRMQAGELLEARPDAHPAGTTVEVRDLFFNTPARAKFLRTVSTELSRITEIVQAAALAHPERRFRLAHEGREILAAVGGVSTEERIRQIFGRELASGLLPISRGTSPLRVTGYLSRPTFSRATRSHWFLFVNDRPVADRTLTHAVTQACRTRFPRDRYPAAFVFVEVPAAEVDVNVHPAKREVRFRTPGAVHDLVQKALEDALGGGPVQEFAPIEPGPDRRVGEAVSDYLARSPAPAPVPGAFRGPRELPGSDAPGVEAGSAELPTAGSARRILGQLRDAFILVEEDAGLLLVDQHAAHERVLYDRYREDLRAGEVPTQSLLFPATVELAPAELELLLPALDSLRHLGFGLEPFGREALLVREVPSRLSSLDPVRAIQDLAGGGNPVEDMEHRVAALGACHAAVRAGMRLDGARLDRIVRDLLDGGHDLTCPHGRPATLRYPLREIERAFLRP